MQKDYLLVRLDDVAAALAEYLSASIVNRVRLALLSKAVEHDEAEAGRAFVELIAEFRQSLAAFRGTVAVLKDDTQEKSGSVRSASNQELLESLFALLRRYKLLVDEMGAKDLEAFLVLLVGNAEKIEKASVGYEQLVISLTEAKADYDEILDDIRGSKTMTSAEAGQIVAELVDFLLRLLSDDGLLKSRFVKVVDLPPVTRQAFEREIQRYVLR